jgi:siroheme decarboxylase
MDELNCRILETLQNEFPLSQYPYEIMSGKLGISCEKLMARLQLLKDDGAIRRMGASLDSRRFGYKSTLAAISVKQSALERACEIIAGFSEITHSYLRNDRFNIWFTVIAQDDKEIERIIGKIQSALSLESSQVLNLPMKRVFKLNASFNIPS